MGTMNWLLLLLIFLILAKAFEVRAGYPSHRDYISLIGQINTKKKEEEKTAEITFFLKKATKYFPPFF